MKRSHIRRALEALSPIAALRLPLRTGGLDLGALISRGALIRGAGLGFGAILTGAWRGTLYAQKGLRLATQTANAPSLLAACILSPEMTEGPYYIAKEKVRKNITENHPGTPLQLRLTVVDAATCAPIKNAAVDIWHCDAGGIYSGFVAASTGGAPGSSGPTDKNTFLRGIQFTDAHGLAQFQSIYPGWYRGRTVHIHVKVHLAHDPTGHVVHTGQLFFADTLTAQVYKKAPYKSRAAARDTFNSTDNIYQNGGAQSLLTMKHDGKGGYIGAITLGVRNA